ncbi:MAG: DUF4956 domain-containing protein [Cellulomonadaceae bacterium]|jgi:hypothetical protein|nr:DUF4956 domain-containing protein [Cellulomonadaceae bacterium]
MTEVITAVATGFGAWAAPGFWVANLVAVSVLTFALYFPRHRRREMVVAFLGVNIAVAVVSAVLVSAGTSLGIGLGLFGMLSIIRLRSALIGHREVAYYFAALALGVLGGMGVALGWLALLGMLLIVMVLGFADHPRILPGYETQTIILDRAITDRIALTAHLESLLGGRVHQIHVKETDLKKKTTTVEVRFVAPTANAAWLPAIIETDAAPNDWDKESVSEPIFA